MKRIADIYKDVEKLHKAQREKIKKSYKRVLPFSEEITDRFDKARFLDFGKGSSIYDNSFVFGDVEVGRDTWIGPFTILDVSGGLKIGANCSISAGVHIYTHDTVAWALSGGKKGYEYSGVEIGNNCHIGANTIIVKGVRIGNGCAIGACSFIKNDIPDNSVAFGTPAKVVGKVSVDKKGKITFKYKKR